MCILVYYIGFYPAVPQGRDAEPPAPDPLLDRHGETRDHLPRRHKVQT